MKNFKVYKVFTKSDYSYCYSKEAALYKRMTMQNAGFTKVMIKGRY